MEFTLEEKEILIDALDVFQEYVGEQISKCELNKMERFIPGYLEAGEIAAGLEEKVRNFR